MGWSNCPLLHYTFRPDYVGVNSAGFIDFQHALVYTLAYDSLNLEV